MMKRFEHKTQLDSVNNTELEGWELIESQAIYGGLTGDFIGYVNKYQRELPEETKNENL